MKKVIIYETKMCPYCRMAKSYLKNKNIDFETINLTLRPEKLEELKNRTNMRTVPQIFIGDYFVGGYSELTSLPDEKINTLLKEG